MNLRNKIATLALAATMTLGMGTSAMAQTANGQVSVQVIPGTLTYSIENAILDEVRYSEVPTSSAGTLQLSMNGNGNLAGWTLSVQATEDFDYNGTSANGQDIPAANLSLTQPQAPSHIAGQAIDGTNGPVPTTSAGSLGSSLSVITSAPGHGSGSYSQNLGVSLAIPEYSQVGTYTGVVTVMASAAPGGE